MGRVINPGRLPLPRRPKAFYRVSRGRQKNSTITLFVDEQQEGTFVDDAALKSYLQDLADSDGKDIVPESGGRGMTVFRPKPSEQSIQH
jgi:hypothetical protein